jgi:hypothetical protein
MISPIAATLAAFSVHTTIGVTNSVQLFSPLPDRIFRAVAVVGHAAAHPIWSLRFPRGSHGFLHKRIDNRFL